MTKRLAEWMRRLADRLDPPAPPIQPKKRHFEWTIPEDARLTSLECHFMQPESADIESDNTPPQGNHDH